jgi:hypothetical protein
MARHLHWVEWGTYASYAQIKEYVAISPLSGPLRDASGRGGPWRARAYDRDAIRE